MNVSALAQTFAERLPACLLGGAAVVLFAWAILTLASQQNSRTRFAVWFSSLLAIMLFLGFSARQPFAASIASGPVVARQALVHLPASWALYLFEFWLGCSGLALARLGVGLWRVHRLRKACVAVDVERLTPEVRQTLHRFGSARHITLCVSDQVAVPTAIGFFRPAVVIPRWLMQELSSPELKQVLLHELAHLQRWDDWTNLVQRVLSAILFFHPAVWFLHERLSAERENACDDFVMTETGDPGAYARCLALLAEKTFARRSMALAHALVTRLGKTSRRVGRILHITNPRTAPVWKAGVLFVAIFSCACIAYQWHAPKLLAFQNNTVTAMPASLAEHAPSPYTPKPLSQTATNTRLAAKSRPVESAHATHVTNAAFSPQPSRHRTYVHSPQVDPGVVLAEAHAIQPHASVEEEAVFVYVDGRQDSAGNLIAWRLTVWRVVNYQPANSTHGKVT